MLEFKVIQELKPNTEILEIIKNYTHKVTKGKIKHLLKIPIYNLSLQQNT